MKRFARYFISNSFVRDEYTCPDWNEAQKFDFAMKRYLTKPHKRVFPLSIPFMNDVLWKSNVASIATLWREKIQKRGEKLKKRRKQKKKKRKQRVIEVSWTCNDGVIETQGPIESVVYQFVVSCIPIDKTSLFLEIPILLTCTILFIGILDRQKLFRFVFWSFVTSWLNYPS